MMTDPAWSKSAEKASEWQLNRNWMAVVCQTHDCWCCLLWWYLLQKSCHAIITDGDVNYYRVSTRAVNGYPGVRLSNRSPGSKISARVGTVGPPVVINTCWLARISAAMKFCIFRVVVVLLSATEASHLSGRQGADEVGRAGWVCGLAAWVTLPPAVLLQRQDAIAITRRPRLHPHSQQWLLNLTWHCRLFNFSQSQLGRLLPG